jgi:transcriptional regulator with GAF, ATPase, and Fis domain
MSRVRDLIAQVAPTDAFVLITGESGTGKELAAAAIHDASARADRPLVRVNCAAIPESLFESEFFGHRRGAFSGAIADRTGRFAEADGGTLVLDEIGTLGLDMQAKLLRVLESGEYQVVGESRTRVADVRLIAVTNENMDARVKEGTFRSDLFYRINIFPITVPPLREHASDLPELVTHVLGRLASRRGGPSDAVSRLSPDALASLRAYRWPGNVRELRNVLERALIVSGPGAPTAATFAGILEAPMRAGDAIGQDAFHLRRNLDDHERQLILAALEETGGRKKEAAGLLGVDPRNLGYYLRKHGLQDGGTG